MRIELGELTPHNVKQLRLINKVIFPVSYNDKFYKDVLGYGEMVKLAYYDSVIVGAVCCRIEKASDTGAQQMYIMTLGCLAAYRNLGIGSTMLRHVLAIARARPELTCIYLHVQTSNGDAVAFYKKFGFEIVETKEAYYKKIEPAAAHILRYDLTKNEVREE